MLFSYRIVLKDGLLVVAAVGHVVYRHYGDGQSSDAHLSHGSLAQAAFAHHTTFRHHSHRVYLNGSPNT